jgi:hypothetical protein
MSLLDSDYFPFLVIVLILFISWNAKYNHAINSDDLKEPQQEPQKRVSELRKYLRIQRMMGA